MIVQLIGTKYVQICEVVWAESRTMNSLPNPFGTRLMSIIFCFQNTPVQLTNLIKKLPNQANKIQQVSENCKPLAL